MSQTDTICDLLDQIFWVPHKKPDIDDDVEIWLADLEALPLEKIERYIHFDLR